ncbi:MAG: LuxR C-terminal-related transcriptional regulator [Bacteroidales bacterium]
MDREKYMDQIRNNKSEEAARFLLDGNGMVISCNDCASRMFGYKSPDELVGVSYKDLVPEEFARFLPDSITLDYLTNGLFLPRVNRCADDTLISTLIKTEYIYLDNICHVETTAILNPEIIHIGEMRYKQLSEILKCELDLLKNKEMTADSNYINRLLQLQLADYSLTIKEVQFCSLLHSGMHTKEIADVLSLTIESIYSFRKRLRKKMNLSPKTDLFTFLQRLTKEN